MSRRSETGQVQSVRKAMDLLACLAQARGPLSLGELSARTGIPKATAHGLLSSMRPSAVVEQSAEDGRYRLGIRLFEYGCVVSRDWNVLEAAAEPMRRVAEETGETVSIAALDRGEVLVLDCADATATCGSSRKRGHGCRSTAPPKGSCCWPTCRRRGGGACCGAVISLSTRPTDTPALRLWRRNWRTFWNGATRLRMESTALDCGASPRRCST